MPGDFHIHTVYSDGSLSIDEVMAMAVSQGLDIIAITDHDTTEGAILAKSKETESLKILVGLELSTERNHESIHILGFFRDLSRISDLDCYLKEQRANRLRRAYRIHDLLQEHFAIDLNMEFAQTLPSITRGTIAEQILKQGFPYTRQEIFQKMIGKDCPAYIPSTKLETRHGIRLIHDCLGMAVIAHPILYTNNNLDDLILLGADGIEAIYRSDSNEKNKEMIQYAKANHLLISAGSDFHSLHDSSHGNIGDVRYSGESFRKFLDTVWE